jgi:hypothetical protein
MVNKDERKLLKELLYKDIQSDGMKDHLAKRLAGSTVT